MAQHLTIAFDRNSDLFLDGQGNLAMATGRYALSYITLNAIRTVRGELIYNTEAGVPYFTTVFENPPNLRLWEYYVRENALAVDGVISVDSFLCEIKNNAVSYEMVMSTERGGVPIGNRGNMLILDETDPALPETEEITPDSIPITITARNLWVDTFTGNTIFSQTLNPTPGTPLYNVTSIQDYLRDGETYTEAQMRLAGSTVADVIVFQYLRVNNDYYWRNESADSGITYNTIRVHKLEHPSNCEPTIDKQLWSANVIGGSIGRVFSTASMTSNPENKDDYLTKNITVSDGVIWRNDITLFYCYKPDSPAPYGTYPYLVFTGATVTGQYLEQMDIYHEMIPFSSDYQYPWPNPPKSVWVASSFIGSFYFHSDYFPTIEPEFDEYGLMISPEPGDGNWVEVGRGYGDDICSCYDTYYRFIPPPDEIGGWVFEIVDSAQAWSVSPAVGNDTVYTSFTGGTADLSVCYENSDLTGGTASVTATGYAAYAIITLRGETFYNTMKFNEE